MPTAVLLFAYLILPFTSFLFPFSVETGSAELAAIPSVSCPSPAFSGSRVSPMLTAGGANTVGDFNGDGRTDLVVQYGSSATLYIQLAVGNGYVGTARVIDGNSTGFSVASGDFNNDGRLDIVTAAKIYFGDGTGDFSSPRLLLLTSSTLGYVAGDFNGDDSLDIAGYSFSNGNIEVFFGDGTGGFTGPTVLTFSGSSGGIEIGDLNGDGITDILTTISNANTVSVALGSTSGVFQAPVNYPIGGTGSVSLITTGDLDGDGDNDILSSSSAFGEPSAFMAVLKNNGNGAFTVQPRFTEPSTNLSRLLIADIDSDGKNDLIANAGLSTITLRLGNNDGTFQASRSIPGFVGQAQLYFQDFTGDGIRDLGVPSTTVASFAVLVNDGTGHLGLDEFVIDSDYFVADLVQNDFNADGRPDIAYATESTNVKIVFGDGNGNFGSMVTAPVSRRPRFMNSGDINNDGKQDLVLIIQNDGDLGSKVAVLFGNGNGTFQPAIELTEFNGPVRRRPILADMNGDGLPELILNGSNTHLVNIFQNVGSGVFVFRTNFDAGNTVGAYNAGDYNGDGKIDLAVLSYGVNLYLGNGGFGFELAGQFPAGQVNNQMVTDDLNRDGILDIVATTEQFGPSPAPGKAVVLLGVGEGGFGAPTEYIIGRGSSSIGIADFDGDGNKDIAVTNSGISVNTDTRVSVLYGDGTGVFPRLTFTAAAPFPRGMLVNDYNSDGRPDIIVAGYNLGDLVKLFGQCNAPPASDLPVVSVGDASVNEGNSGENQVSVTVSLNSPGTTIVRVRYYTAPLLGIANLSEEGLMAPSGGRDYRPVSGELQFLPGETSKTFQFAARGDLIDEYDEKVSVFLANATNASLGDNQGVVTIIDDDAPPGISAGNASGSEGNTGNSPILVPLSLSSVSEKPINVQFVTGGGTAVPNQDFVWAQGTASIPAGQTGVTVAVNTIGDLTVEPDETFILEISEPLNVTIANARSTGTIVNDDVGGSVQFAGATFTGTEVGGGLTVGITRTGGNGGGVSVRFRTQAGTAMPGQDYTDVTQTITLGDNETGRGVYIPITYDQLDEPDETLTLILDQPSGVTIGSPATASMTIQNSPNVPDLSITDASVAEGDNGITYMQFSVRLSRPTQRPVRVDYATAPDTATAGVDYLTSSGSFTVRAGVTRSNLSIPVVGDFMFEPDETFFINLSNPANANLVDNQAIGRILNDEVNTGSSTKLVSVNRTNTGDANLDSAEPSISDDGKVIAFESYASDLVSGDTNGIRDVYVRNMETGATSLVSANLTGNGGNCESRKPAVSGNGRFVAFNSCASDLIASGTASQFSVYRRDLQTNATEIVSVNVGGNPGGVEGTISPTISYDGRYIVFQSRNQDLTSIPDSQNFLDIFIRDMQTNLTRMVTVNVAGTGPGDTDSGNVSSLNNNIKITPDGRFVLFPSAATNLVTTPAGGGVNLFVRDTTGQTTVPVSVNSANNLLVGTDPTSSVSDDGRFVVFSSGSGAIVPTDTNNAPDVFRRDLQANSVLLVSSNVGGTGSGNGASSKPSCSADCRYIGFESAASDLSNFSDTNAVSDVYWKDVVSGSTKIVSINNSGTNGGNQYSSKTKVARDGQTVLFTSAASDLVPPPIDNNLNFDLFVRDIPGNSTKVASANEGGTIVGNQGATDGLISGDGNAVTFASGSDNLVRNDTNGQIPDIFAYSKNVSIKPLWDFDGDARSDLSVFRPTNGFWYIKNSRDGSLRAQQFGISTDVPVSNDYDGDGKTDIGVFRDGVWYVFNSATGTVTGRNFGQVGDLPIAGDFDGDRRADLAVYRSGVWLINESSDGNTRIVQFGIASDTPVAADYDGDLRSDIAVFRGGVWYIIRSIDFTVRIDQFGLAGDTPVQGDFDGDNAADLAVFRPSIGSWFILMSHNGGFSAAQFGNATDVPLKGDYDGDGKADIAVFRDGVWWVLLSSNQSVQATQFGSPGDIAVPGR